MVHQECAVTEFTLSPRKLRIVWKSYCRGLSAQRAAYVAGCHVGTAERCYRKFKSGIIPELRTTGPLVASLDKKVKEIWRAEARKRGVSVQRLAHRVVSLVANDNLFDAILGKTNDRKHCDQAKENIREVLASIRD